MNLLTTTTIKGDSDDGFIHDHVNDDAHVDDDDDHVYVSVITQKVIPVLSKIGRASCRERV